MATGRPYISNGLTSRLAKQQVVVVAVPTRDANGKLTGLLAGALELSPPSGQENPQAAALGFTDLVLLDREGQQLTQADASRLPRTRSSSREISSGQGVESGVEGLNGGKDRVVA